MNPHGPLTEKQPLRFLRQINGLSELTLDAESFTVHSVTHNGVPLSFTHQQGKLEIGLDRILAVGEKATLTIGYSVANIDVDSARFGMGASYDLGIQLQARNRRPTRQSYLRSTSRKVHATGFHRSTTRATGRHMRLSFK